jgi:anti-sigma factor RsiW
MTCKDIKTRLPAYMEGDMPPEEKEGLERHLESCPSCSTALAELKRAVELVQNVPEVEPPPWLKTRVMVQIREEAEARQGILHRLFYPFRIKVPVQAFAILLVSVLAVYIYKATIPELSLMKTPATDIQQMKDSERVKVPEKTRAKAEVPAVRQEPAAKPSQEKVDLERNVAGSPSMPSSLPREPAGKAVSGEKQDIPGSMKDENTVEMSAAKRSDVSALRSAPAPQATAKAKEQVLDRYEEKDRRERKGTLAAPAPAMGAGAAKKPIPATLVPGFTVGLMAKDPPVAAEEVEKLLTRLGALGLKRTSEEGKETVVAQIPSIKLKGFLENLESLGTIRDKPASTDTPEDNLFLQIEIVATP